MALIHILLVISIQCFTPIYSKYLFILHDAGESYMAYDPIINLIDQGESLNVLVLGEPSTSIYADLNSSVTLNDIGVNVTILDGTPQARIQLLLPSDVDKVVSYVSPNDDKVTVCNSGMVYAMQAQLTEAFKLDYAYTIDFDDSFALWSNDSLPAKLFVQNYVFLNNNPIADEIFTTADSISAGASTTSDGSIIATTVGSPTLQDWANDAANSTMIKITRQIILSQYDKSDQFEESDILVLIYAGGYGGDEYTVSLSLLCGAALALQQDGFLFVFSPHPGYPSSYEEALFTQWGCGDSLLVYNESIWLYLLNTSQLVVASNGSLSEGSTVGGQSLSVTKPHTYTSLTYQDVFTDAGLIQTSPDNATLLNTLNVTFRGEDYFVSPSAMDRAGVPLNGTQNIVARLLEIEDGSNT